MTPAMTPARALAAMEATWPSAAVQQVGPVTVRLGQGGGSRVSAATAAGPVGDDDIAAAEAAMRALGQAPLFRVGPEEGALDAALAARGYAVADEVLLLAAPVAALARARPPVTTFEVWPPLAVEVEIWAAEGIGAARRAVMERVPGPKTTILGRIEDRPAGVAFVAADGDVAMVHAMVVAPRFRRKGLARHMVAAAAVWAAGQGAMTLALAVTRANAPARALYSSLGMGQVAEYRYRALSG